MADFDVLFDDANAFYRAGQHITGRVAVNARTEVPSTDIWLILKGKSHTFWVNKSSEAIFESDQAHLHVRVPVGNVQMLLPPGMHQLPFDYELPQNLPSSFEVLEDQASVDYDVSGYTRYTCVVKLAEQEEYACEKSFKVFSLVFPEAYPNYLAPVRFSQDVDLMNAIGIDGLVRVTIELPKSLYSSGETLPVVIIADNQSQYSVKQVNVLLLQSMELIAESRYEDITDTVDYVKCIESAQCGSVEANTSIRLTTQLVVPLAPPTQRQGIIRIQYILKLTSDCDEFDISLPIMLR